MEEIEANNLVKKGQLLLQCSLTNLSPNYVEAVDYFNKAFNIYKKVKRNDKIVEIAELLVLCYDKLGSYKSAYLVIVDVLMLNSCLDISNDLKVSLLNKAIYYNNLTGEPISHIVLAKLLKNSSSIDFSKTILFTFANDIDDIYKIDLYRIYVDFVLKKNNFSEALNIYTLQIPLFKKLEQPHNVYKAILSTIIVCVLMNDIVSAEKEYMKYVSTDFIHSEECEAANELIESVKNMEPMDKILNMYRVKILDHELIKHLKRNKIDAQEHIL